jgi:hypothetical protein
MAKSTDIAQIIESSMKFCFESVLAFIEDKVCPHVAYIQGVD